MPETVHYNLGLWSSITRGFEKKTDHIEKNPNFEVREADREIWVFSRYDRVFSRNIELSSITLVISQEAVFYEVYFHFF